MLEHRLSRPAFVNEKLTEEINFPPKNEQFLNALRIHEARLLQTNRLKEKEELQRRKNLIKDIISFRVSMTPVTQCVAYPDVVQCFYQMNQTNNPQKKSKDANSEEPSNKFSVVLSFKNPVPSL